MLDHLPGTILYQEPDLSIPASERSFYALPRKKRVVEERIQFRDYRTATDIAKGSEGLDVQGFTYVKHQSALANSEDWFHGTNVEDTYIPELEKLILEVTRARKAVVNNVVIRRKAVDLEEAKDLGHYDKRGSDRDVAFSKLPRDRAPVGGREYESAVGPLREAHVDYSPEGLRATARFCRQDIKAAAQQALKAEDANADHVPRYAAYSIWRPLNKVVRRDPLAVCDWRSLDPAKDLCQFDYRALSDVTDSGEYLLAAWACLPPQQPIQQKWYFMPEQTNEDVLILKFADTAADKDENIAGGCPHVSPAMPGTEEEELRESVEARVFVFW